ncbi:hypothetical protein FS749_012350 [Ceratobasidium sp. UAMH 11750]|nr:hypothetical protein FS749_012350 [Ceratobasidium sp. UAMH 11750]
MKLTTALAIALSANGVFGHYIFNKLIVNGVTGAAFANIRPVPNNSPVTSVTVNDIRCNVGGTSGGSTTTATTSAGSTVGFVLDNTVYHQGPLAVYLGKAPGSVSTWDGSGANWFKIYELGATFNPFKFLSEGKIFLAAYNFLCSMSSPPRSIDLHVQDPQLDPSWRIPPSY